MAIELNINNAGSFKAWMTRFSSGQLRDMSQNGARGGYDGLIWTDDVIDLYNKFEDEMWEILTENANNQGESVLSFVAQLRDANEIETPREFKEFVTYFCAEAVAADCVREFEEIDGFEYEYD